MENLVSRRAYDASLDFPLRLPLIIGVVGGLLFGLGLGLFLTLSLELVGSLILSSSVRVFNVRIVLWVAIASGVPFGLILALVIPARLRKTMTSFIDAVYADDPNVVELPAAVEEFSHRLPCSWMKKDKLSVGGVLYLGKVSFMFVPYKKNLPQHREPFEIAPLDNVRFSLVQAKNFLARLLFKKLPPHLEIAWSRGKARFLVPDPEHTLMRIQGLALPVNE